MTTTHCSCSTRPLPAPASRGGYSTWNQPARQPRCTGSAALTSFRYPMWTSSTRRPRSLPAPTHLVARHGEVFLGRRELRPSGTEVSFGPTTIGDGSVAVIAGPCAVESPEQTMATAAVVAEHGAVGLRGGVFKPRTSPHSFQGLQWDGLDLLAEARERTGLPVVTEVVDPGARQAAGRRWSTDCRSVHGTCRTSRC